VSRKSDGHGRRRKKAGGDLEFYDLVLYISGITKRSSSAVASVKAVGDKHLTGRYRLSVVDVFQEPWRAREQDVAAVPMLVKTLPLPLIKLVGDLSSEERLLSELKLVPRPA
jgi:circadian clock protein KaiB